MSRTTKLSELTDELKRCGEMLIGISASMQDIVSTADETEVTDWEELTDEEPTDVPILLGDVRAVLAEKSRMGMTSAVRNLLNEYGVEKLSKLNPRYYAEILKKAEELNNGV